MPLPLQSWRRFSLVTFVSVVSFFLFLQAALWQYHRYHYKLVIAQRLLYAQEKKVLSYPFHHQTNDEFLLLSDQGRYLTDALFLWDGSMREGKRGYLVLVPFLSLKTGHVFLVDQGWMRLHDLSDHSMCLNHIRAVLAKQNVVQGLARHFPSPHSFFKTVSSHNGLVLSRLDANVLSQKIHQPVDAWILVPPHASCLLPSPQHPIGVSAERHLNYVYQWLTFSALTLLLYLRYVFHFFKFSGGKSVSEG